MIAPFPDHCILHCLISSFREATVGVNKTFRMFQQLLQFGTAKLRFRLTKDFCSINARKNRIEQTEHFTTIYHKNDALSDAITSSSPTK